MRRAGIALVGVWWCLWVCLGDVRAGEVTAAAPQPRQISVLDGLPSNRVNGLAEDQQGYLWMATLDGLARYDGLGFRVWRVEDGLLDNFIWSVHVDAQDRVWVGTRRGGLSMFDAQRATFTHVNHETHPGVGVDDIWSVMSTGDGSIWFGTSESGLYRLGPDGRMARFNADLTDPRSLPSDSVAYLEVDAAGTLWVGTKDGVAAWTGHDFERIAMPPATPRQVNGLTFDTAGHLWIGSAHSGVVHRTDGRTEPMPWEDPVLHQPVLHMLVQDRQGARWFDTRSGLAREIEGRIEDVPLFSFAARGNVRPSWSSAFEDREGGLWFASVDAGLWYLPANWRNFTVLQRRMSDPATLANAFVRGVAASSEGGLWLVGTGGVLDHLDPRTGRVEHRLTDVCGRQVNRSVYQTSTGMVWIGCLRQLVRFDPTTGEARSWYQDDDVDPAPSGHHIDGIVEVADGTLWFSSDLGLQARTPDGRVIDTIQAGDGRGLPAMVRPLQIVRSPEGGLWLATTRGLYMWNATRRAFEPVPGGPQRNLDVVVQPNSDAVWLSGLGKIEHYRWDGTALTLQRRFDRRDGLPQVMPGGMVVDDDGILWMTTVRGLVRFDPAKSGVRVYGVLDGLPSQEFSDQQIGVAHDGHFAVGTGEGLLLFHPRDVQRRAETPPLVIEALDLRRGDDVIDVPVDEAVRLRHGDRDLRVVVRLLSFTDAHAHHYRFRLDGYESDWVNADTSAERVFPRLESGRYTLYIEARTEDGEWVALAPLAIRQAPPWWRTAWAVLAGVLLVGLLLWRAALAYRGRIRRRHDWQLAEEKRELAEQASLAKTRFLATLGHEVRTPMTGVLGMSELLLDTPLEPRQREYTLAIRRAGDHLMRLVNDALDLARIEAGKLELDLQPFDVHALVQDIVALCAPMARHKSLGFDVVFEDRVPPWVRGDAVRVRQVLLNLIGNALKFTETGHVALHVAPADVGVTFSVRDTGPGLSADEVTRLFRRFEQAEGARTAARYGGSGLGLAISQELSAAMGGRIDVASTLGAGTRFDVTLPLASVAPVVPRHAVPGHERITAAVELDVLLVEDDATVAEVIVGLLRGQGHQIVHVAHGLAALAEVASRPFDIALLDLDLPGVDGLTLAGLLRAQGFERPLVAVTARADPEAEPAARAAGFDGFLRKPLTGEILADALAQSWRPVDLGAGLEAPD